MKKLFDILEHPVFMILIAFCLYLSVFCLVSNGGVLGEPVHGPSIFFGIVLTWAAEMFGVGITDFLNRKSSAAADNDKS